VVSPSARRRAVKMSIEEGIKNWPGSVRRWAVAVKLISQLAIENGSGASARKCSSSARKSSLPILANYRVNAGVKVRGQCETSGADSTRRNHSEQETMPQDTTCGSRRQSGNGRERQDKFAAWDLSPTRPKTGSCSRILLPAEHTRRCLSIHPE
jgi:hypothetical protein